MRVLSRRTSRDVLIPRRKYSSLVVSETKSPRAARIPEEVVAEDVDEEPRAPRTPAERRARTVMVLSGLILVTYGLTLAGIHAAHYPQLVCDLLFVAFVGYSRWQAVQRTKRRASRPRPAYVAAEEPVPVLTPMPRVAGIPDRMPGRPAPLTISLPAPAARYEDRPLAPAAASEWSPVPVPPPTYVGKPVAPARPRRVLDLTKPGEWTAALEGEDVGLGILDDGPELEDIIERRRAAGDW